MSSLLNLPSSLTCFLLLLILPRAFADPATLDFTDCSQSNHSTAQQLNITNVYAQILPSDVFGTYMNLTLIGESTQEIAGFSNTSNSLSTLFTTTSILTLTAWSNETYLCTTLRPPSPLPALASNTSSYCPVGPGPFAFALTIPLGGRRALTTLTTQVRAVDPYTNELFCIDVSTTPLQPTSHSPYGQAKIIVWTTAALTIGYWIVVGIARVISAWGRGITEKGLWARARSAGFILASAISGERLAASPALMRFCTPSMRDVIFHTQWCSALAMVAVEWPAFVYPIFRQTAWSTLTYNITLIPSSDDHHWNPLATLPFSPPQNFADQFADPSSPLYVNPSAPNLLFTLPENATLGISSFAYSCGLRPEDLFSTCLILFLGINAATIAVSAIVWFIDHIANTVFGSNNDSPYPGLHTVGGYDRSKEAEATADPEMSPEETKSQNGNFPSLLKPSARFNLSSIASTGDRGTGSYRAWWKIRSDINSFHGCVLHGNLVRILVLFHLPVTIFSCYHMTLPRDGASLASIVLAALSFVFFSVLIPAHLVLRVTFTSTNKLYDETRTLLNYGALYNHYRHGSQMFASLLFATNIVFGVTIGVGQKSGTAQAIIILVVEVISALVTSIWLPWGSGASMGLISFLFCVARIVMAVLLVILTPTISIGTGPAGWVAYGILIIMALIFLALALMLLIKLLEAAIRIVGGVDFDRSRHVMDSGLFGVLGLLGCCGSPSGGRRRRRSKHRRAEKKAYRTSDSSEMPTLTPHTTYDTTRFGQPPFSDTGFQKGSPTSAPTPSVLRPEHALRPYREDSDDEGYIMGAWKPFATQRPGYTPVSESTRGGASSPPKQPSSGFSRVGGGRANMDSPYSISHGGRASGSMHSFPSIGDKHSPIGPGPSSLSNPVFYDDDDSPQASLSNVSNIGLSALPPGAMQPSHARTKSQTAVIEDAGWMAPISSGQTMQQALGNASGIVAGSLRPRLLSLMTGSAGNNASSSQAAPVGIGMNVSYAPSDDDDSERQTRKKKPWYFLKRHRPHASEDSYMGPPPPVEPEFGGLDSSRASSQPGRSFVVIRKNQSARPTPGPSTSGERPTSAPGDFKTATANF